MDNGGNMFFTTPSNRDRSLNYSNNNNSTNNVEFDNMWAFNHGLIFTTATATTADAAATTKQSETSATHALMFHPSNSHQHHHQQSLYAGDGSHLYPDPHLTCLKLGKRHYFEDATAMGDRQVGGFSLVKKGKSYYGAGARVGSLSDSAVVVGSTAATVPRCQVEGCHVALINTKEYHRRHKVCEKHSKAPKVVVLGLEQRFCQQCSRFHVVSEFDDSKRSCRRRLAGHNERRRKGSHDSLSKNYSSQGPALSLLSSNVNTWISSSSTPDLSSRCSAALRELIAENRATIFTRHLVHNPMNHHDLLDNGSNGCINLSSNITHPQQMLTDQTNGSWSRYQVSNNPHVTLDLMQAPTAEFGFLSVRNGKNAKAGGDADEHEEEEGEECCDLWNSIPWREAM